MQQEEFLKYFRASAASFETEFSTQQSNLKSQHPNSGYLTRKLDLHTTYYYQLNARHIQHAAAPEYFQKCVNMNMQYIMQNQGEIMCIVWRVTFNNKKIYFQFFRHQVTDSMCIPIESVITEVAQITVLNVFHFQEKIRKLNI